MVALSIVTLVLLFLTVDFFYQRWSLRRAAARAPALVARAVHLPAHAEHVPQGLFVAPGHTWLAIEESGEVVVGADPIAATMMGDLDHVELKPAGARVRPGEVLATLEKGDRRIELRSAVEGVIEAVNTDPERDPDTLRRDPFGNGWLYRIRPAGLASRLKDMNIGGDAATFMARELGRMRDALARAGGSAVGPTLADGGPIAAGAAVPVDDETFDEIAALLFDTAHPAA